MNFLSSNDIKQLSRQSQVCTKTFHPPKSIRPPPSDFPVNQKINSHKEWQHYSWILNRVFYFSQLLAPCRTQTIFVWSFPKSKFRFWKQQWCGFDWKNKFPWMYKKRYCKKHCKYPEVFFCFSFLLGHRKQLFELVNACNPFFFLKMYFCHSCLSIATSFLL